MFRLTNLTPKALLRRLALVIATFGCMATVDLEAAPERVWPNVVLIMSDDQGSLDLGSYGATDLHTPHLDALAARGVRFAQFYVGSAVCSPSRASMMTGKSPQGAGLEMNAPRNPVYAGLPPDQVTIAELLKEQGYTTAQIGKWHLGHEAPLRPIDQGFDYAFGPYQGCIDNFSHFFYWVPPNRHDLWENGEERFEDGRYFPDLMNERARRFIAANRDRPFFLYFAPNMPHYPLQGTTKWRDYYRDLPMPRREYAAAVSTVDEQVGQLVDDLRTQGVLENTIIVFLSDHGHSSEERAFGGGGWAGPMRGSKFGLFEGGIRVPAIIAGPGVPEGLVINSPAMQMDLYPTIAELCGVTTLPAGIEGTSLRPMFTQDVPVRDVMYWRMNQRWAVRSGPWKLLVNPRDDSRPGSLDPIFDQVFLANLDDDIGENINLAIHHPDKVHELIDLYRQWQHFRPSDYEQIPGSWRRPGTDEAPCDDGAPADPQLTPTDLVPVESPNAPMPMPARAESVH